MPLDVTFVNQGKEEFTAYCHAVPRVGDLVELVEHYRVAGNEELSTATAYYVVEKILYSYDGYPGVKVYRESTIVVRVRPATAPEALTV